MIKKIEALSIVATLAAILVSPSFAGEQRGDGGTTPIGGNGPDVEAAICAFSGLEDDPVSGEEVEPGETQTPHYVEGFFPPPGSASVCQFANPGRSNQPPPE